MPAGPWIGPAIAGGASLLGGFLGNRAARQESQRNRDFQERMRNTAWQAAVEDMKAAGINPAVAYSKGPAAAPGGSMAAQQDPVTPGVSSALAARRQHEELKLLAAQVKKSEAEADLTDYRGLMERLRLFSYGAKKNKDGSLFIDLGTKESERMTREIEARIGLSEAQAQRFLQDVMMNQPLIDMLQAPGGLKSQDVWIRLILGMLLGRKGGM